MLVLPSVAIKLVPTHHTHAMRSRSRCNYDVCGRRCAETYWGPHLVTCISDENLSTQRYVARKFAPLIESPHLFRATSSFSMLRMPECKVARRSAWQSSLTVQTNPSLKRHTNWMKGVGQMSDAWQIMKAQNQILLPSPSCPGPESVPSFLLFFCN